MVYSSAAGMEGDAQQRHTMLDPLAHLLANPADTTLSEDVVQAEARVSRSQVLPFPLAAQGRPEQAVVHEAVLTKAQASLRVAHTVQAQRWRASVLGSELHHSVTHYCKRCIVYATLLCLQCVRPSRASLCAWRDERVEKGTLDSCQHCTRLCCPRWGTVRGPENPSLVGGCLASVRAGFVC